MIIHLEFVTDTADYWKTFTQECFLLKRGEAMEKLSEMNIYIYLNVVGPKKSHLQDQGHTLHSPAYNLMKEKKP